MTTPTTGGIDIQKASVRKTIEITYEISGEPVWREVIYKMPKRRLPEEQMRKRMFLAEQLVLSMEGAGDGWRCTQAHITGLSVTGNGEPMEVTHVPAPNGAWPNWVPAWLPSFAWAAEQGEY